MPKLSLNIELYNGHFDNYFSYLIFLLIFLVMPTAWFVSFNVIKTSFSPSILSYKCSEYDQDA